MASDGTSLWVPFIAALLLTISHPALATMTGGTSSVGYVPHPPILINHSNNFTAANGVTGGNGTAGNPYVIEGWEIDASGANGIEVRNAANFLIRHVRINSQGNQEGILLYNVAHSRIEDATVSNTSVSVHLHYGWGLTVANSSLTDNGVGINLDGAEDSIIVGNHFSNNREGGILFNGAVRVAIHGNAFASGGLIFPDGTPNDSDSHNVTPDNLVDGKPLRYYTRCVGLDLDGIPTGQLIVANCQHVEVANLQIAHADAAVVLAHVNYAVIRKSHLSDGLLGISLSYASNVTVEDNTISHNQYGIRLYASTGNTIRHNNFVNNTVQAQDQSGPGNAWDDGYPSGGNYWSDYRGIDRCRGAGQDNCTSPDGIGDTPYNIGRIYPSTDLAYPLSRDRYPLITPYVPTGTSGATEVPPPWAAPLVWAALAVPAAAFGAVLYRRRRR